ncbi:SDR family oxidoreductase [Pseudonocardia xinjiangensis]|uniref:SDR family oxidoreductase n=1 Tax=Pseudonocardia xinjiangensis TaxID=75289 RepID=UPI003D8C4052
MILVTGATGRIGSEAVRLLAEQSSRTRALVRDPSRAPHGPARTGVDIAGGDFDQPETLASAMRGGHLSPDRTRADHLHRCGEGSDRRAGTRDRVPKGHP